jgi:hypothetical protein
MYWEPGSREGRNRDTVCADGHDEGKKFAKRVRNEKESKRDDNWSRVAKVEEYIEGASNF